MPWWAWVVIGISIPVGAWLYLRKGSKAARIAIDQIEERQEAREEEIKAHEKEINSAHADRPDPDIVSDLLRTRD